MQTESFFPSLLSSCVVGWGTKGQDLYNSKSARDKQIVRIIGKVRESLLSLSFFFPRGIYFKCLHCQIIKDPSSPPLQVL